MNKRMGPVSLHYSRTDGKSVCEMHGKAIDLYAAAAFIACEVAERTQPDTGHRKAVMAAIAAAILNEIDEMDDQEEDWDA